MRWSASAVSERDFMGKEGLEEFVEREDLIKKGFTERKIPINHFYKNENNNIIVYYLVKGSLYKRARNVLSQ